MCSVSRSRLTGELTERENLAVHAALQTRSVISLLKLGSSADEIMTDCFGKAMSPIAVLALYNSLTEIWDQRTAQIA